MTDKSDLHNPKGSSNLLQSLSFLSLRHIRMIDEALGTVGDYGEVRIVVEKGRIRFVVTQQSQDALKYQPYTNRNK